MQVRDLDNASWPVGTDLKIVRGSELVATLFHHAEGWKWHPNGRGDNGNKSSRKFWKSPLQACQPRRRTSLDDEVITQPEWLARIQGGSA